SPERRAHRWVCGPDCKRGTWRKSVARSRRAQRAFHESAERRASMRSHGRIFRRGARWWIAYYTYDPDVGRNREFRESAGRQESHAKRLLRQRIAEIYGEKFIGPEAERLVVGELLDAYSEHLCLAGKKSITRAPNGGYRGPAMTLVRTLKDGLGGIR